MREDLATLLEEKCTSLNTQFSEDEKCFFYGLYQSNTTKFKFLPGEKLLLKEIAIHINAVIEAESCDAYMPPFAIPKHFNTQMRRDTSNISVGTYFGKKSTKIRPITATDDTSNLKTEVMEKVKVHCCAVDSNLNEGDFNEEIIEIVNDGTRLFARLKCVFCISEKKNASDKEKSSGKRKFAKNHIIQYDISKATNLPYWNFSNYKNHLKYHTVKSIGQSTKKDKKIGKTKRSKSISKEIVDMTDVEDEEDKIQTDEQSETSLKDESNLNDSSVVVVDEKNVTQDSQDKISSALHRMISEQNLAITQAVYANNEKKFKMRFKLNGASKTVDIIKIKPDGNCLYASLVHQLHNFKVKSDDHVAATINLRKSVIAYINDHFDDFIYEIKGRILEDRESTDEENAKCKTVTDKECETYIDEVLSQNGAWGGSETIKAVSQIEKVNVLIFMERDTMFFPVEFDPNRERLISIAYRRAGNKFNHYDSVCELSSEILFDCINHLTTHIK